MNEQRRWSGWIMIGAILAGLSVAFGAMAAHGIDHYLADVYAGETRKMAGETIPAAEKYLADFKTAANYQMVHALGLIALGLLISFRPSQLLTAAGWCLLLGVLLFSGSLYTLSLTAHSLETSARHAIGLTAACGGMSFIIGWCLFAAAVCPCQKAPIETVPLTTNGS